jgi:hypothetical protein
MKQAISSSDQLLQKLAVRIDRVVRIDLEYFARAPGRKYRVRLASFCEIALTMVLTGSDMFPPPGKWNYSAIHLVAPGVCQRISVHAAAEIDFDSEFYDEQKARAIFDTYLSSRVFVQTRLTPARLSEIYEALYTPAKFKRATSPLFAENS